MSKKLSIIVPVYNVDKYIERCILSIVTQNVSTEHYELIIVNDGSTDDSRLILSHLQDEYPFIQIIDKKNGGLSSARNAAIERASGNYFFFLDSDDWISNDSLNFLLQWIEEYPIDILMFGVCEIYDSGKQHYLTKNLSSNNQVLLVEEYLVDYTLRSSSCMSLFHRDIFFKHNVKFREGFMSEDDDFIVRAFSVSRQIVCNNKVVYYYYQRSGSISNSVQQAHNKKLIKDKTQLLVGLVEYVRPFRGKMKQGLDRKLDFLAVDIIRLLIRKNQSKETINEILQKLRSIGYFPIRKASYLLKYKLFRIIFQTSFSVKFARPFKKYI